MFRNQLAALALFLCASVAHAQAPCIDWRPGFHLPGTDNEIYAVATFDDGTGAGPELYVGGTFHRVNGLSARCIAKWDGTTWSEVGGGIGVGDPNPGVSALAVYDDGNGPALYAAGGFNTAGTSSAHDIARWDGTQWTALGSGIDGSVYALAVFDDGQGPQLYAGGGFTGAGGNTAFRIARWDGNAWSVPAQNGANGEILALAVYDSGTGPALYAGGSFSYLDGPTHRVSKWDGTAWTALPGTMNNAVLALETWNDGTGAALYAAGSFTQAQGNVSRIARWDGTSWSALGSGLAWSTGFATARALAVFDDGTGAALYAGGDFDVVGGASASGIAKWNGTTWSALGSGITFGTNLGPIALGTYDDGQGGGEKLAIAGGFNNAGGFGVEGLAGWRTSWTTFGPGAGLTERVEAMTIHDDGNGPALYMAGSFTAAGGAAGVRNIGRWTGTNLSSLGSGTDGPIYALASHDDGSGRKLYAGGQFFTMNGIPAMGVARWDGTSWSAVGGGLTPVVKEFFLFDEGAGLQLYAKSTFAAITKWDGTNWSPTNWDPAFSAGAFVVFDDGSGPRLCASVSHALAGGGAERGVAALNGTTWTMLGDPFDQGPNTLCVFDDGAGPRLYAFGPFTTIGMLSVASAAKWNGTAWSALGSGLTYPGQGLPIVNTSATWDDHTGALPTLYVAGRFTQAGGISVNNIAQWDGTAWHDVAGGANDQVNAIQVFEQDGGPDLYVGGLFNYAGGKLSYRLARLSNSCSTEIGAPLCHGDGTGAACPCGNASAPGENAGCLNSLGLGGRLRALGKPSAHLDSLVLQASNLPNSAALFYQGTGKVNAGAGSAFGDGLRCAGGSTLRLGIKLNSSGASQYPATGDIKVSVRGAIGSFGGVTRVYQVWYRNPAAFCSSSTFNLTNALEVFWMP